MNSPINPADVVDLAEKATRGTPSPSQSPSPINLTKVISVTRIETDTMEKCHPKIIRSKKYLIFEKVTIAHQTDDDGNIDITPI